MVRAELAEGASPGPEVAQRIVMRLHRDLAGLMGATGLDLMLTRALVLARRDHPLLGAVAVGPDGTLAGLDDTTLDPAALQDAATAVAENFIELLVELIGEDLAKRLVPGPWPTGDEEGEET
jgi:hypothetical protein